MKLGPSFRARNCLILPADGFNAAVARFQHARAGVRSEIAAGSKIGSTVSSRTIMGVTVNYLRKLQGMKFHPPAGFVLKGNHLARSHGFIIPTAGCHFIQGIVPKGITYYLLAFSLAPRLPEEIRAY